MSGLTHLRCDVDAAEATALKPLNFGVDRPNRFLEVLEILVHEPVHTDRCRHFLYRSVFKKSSGDLLINTYSAFRLFTCHRETHRSWAISSLLVGISMPYTFGQTMGGAAETKNTFLGPASRAISTISLAVVPRTTLSSTRRTFLPANCPGAKNNKNQLVWLIWKMKNRVLLQI